MQRRVFGNGAGKGGKLVAALALAALFTAYPGLSWNPWPDAYIFVGTLAAMVAQARGWVEFWFAWLAVDVRPKCTACLPS